MKADEGPHFLGIGAQKAATTWLDRCLRAHPSLWLPPLKELHYFDDRGGRPIFGEGWEGRRLRRQLAARFRADARFLDREGLRWDLRYFFGRRTDEWYLSLFRGGPGRVAGEITPGYAVLDADAVARVHRLLPDLLLVLLLRDPIERSWSQIRMYVGRSGRRVEALSAAELAAIAREERVARRSDYARTLETWERHYAPERFFVGFLEDVRDRPEALLGDLFRFLGVDPTRARLGDLPRRRIHARDARPTVPPALARALARVHLPGLRALEARLGGPVPAWRERAERLADE